MRRKARRRRIRDPRRNHQTRHVSRLLRRLQHRAARLMVRCNRYSTIVALLAARESRRTSGRVRDQRGRRARPRLADEVLIDNELLAERRAVLELHEATRETQARRAHAIRHHEDEVTLAGRVRTAVSRVAMSLVYHCEYDDCSCRKDGPDEQSNLPPKLPRPRSRHSASLCGLSSEERIFLCDVAVAADVAGCAVRKEGSSASHGRLMGMGGKKSRCEGTGVTPRFSAYSGFKSEEDGAAGG